MEVVHGDVEVDFAARGFDAEDHASVSVLPPRPCSLMVNFRREKLLEAEPLVVEKRDAVADVPCWRVRRRFRG